MTGYLEGLLITCLATVLAVWLNDNFDIGGDYIDITSDGT